MSKVNQAELNERITTYLALKNHVEKHMMKIQKEPRLVELLTHLVNFWTGDLFKMYKQIAVDIQVLFNSDFTEGELYRLVHTNKGIK
jgi:hypothetical protein